ncbi:BTAD domain-containing putative transcriptional regulator [Ralstonia soli]|uniref:Transcriptional regulator n=1 Tax=Ralstonia soli TaxID=2953896 RepID=A0ABT1AIL1_9RALS|nr:BTAD domain-containing putative transcriptional regulator [Ralstonia soli]MCO5398230.1 transcriptional regulator [Ralstonia soli]
MISSSILSKLNRPQSGGIVPRPRLLDLIGQRHEASPIVWVSSVAGSGKTKLAASYLDATALRPIWYEVDSGDTDPANVFHYFGLACGMHCPAASLPPFTGDHLFDLATFARRYFRALFSALTQPTLLVIENYHAAEAEPSFNLIMREALCAVPKHVRVLVLSRFSPPATLARLQANQELALLDWQHLKLTEEETRAIVARRIATSAVSAMSATTQALAPDALHELARQLHARSGGWVAAIVLLLDQIGQHDVNHLARLDSRDVLFPYFAQEMFGEATPELRHFLLCTAIPPNFDLTEARALTGNADVDRFVTPTHRQQYFIDQFGRGDGAAYQYHALFREFLLAQLPHAFSAEQRQRLIIDAAAMLAARGDLTGAGELLARAGLWTELATLALQQAPTLMQQGRYRTLSDLLTPLPTGIRSNDPWLLFWSGCCRMALDPAAARQYFEPALALFQGQDNATGCFLAWSSIVDCIYFESRDYRPLDHWLEVLDTLRSRYPVFPDAQTEARVLASVLAALAFYAMEHPDRAAWTDRAHAFIGAVDVQTQASLGFMLTVYHLWTGDLERARVVLQLMRAALAAPETGDLLRTTILTTEAMGYWFFGDNDECIALVDQTEALMHTSGIHLWKHALLDHGLAAAISDGKWAAAEAFRAKMAVDIHTGRPLDQAMHHFECGWLALQQHQLREAELKIEFGLSGFRSLGFRFGVAFSLATSAYVNHVLGHDTRADALAMEAEALARQIDSKVALFQALAVHAAIALDRGQSANPWLAEALALGKRFGVTNFPGWHAGMMASLAAHALAEGIESEYVTALVRKRRLQAPTTRLKHWPWDIDIRVLGTFRVSCSGKPLAQSGKGNRRTLDTLKAIIAYGGRDVAIDHLTAALWPDADGDTAKGAFDVAIHRLRKLLGNTEAIQVGNGKVNLDTRLCGVDLWVFQAACETVLDMAATAEPDADTLLAAAIDMLASYQGDFLADEPEEAWLLPMRERLRAQSVRAALAAGERFEARHAHGLAVTLYQRAVDVHPTAESLCKRLVERLWADGQAAQSKAFFAEWKHTLKAVYGAEPSRALAAMLEQLQ